MTTPLPATVQSMLGEPAASDLARWLERTMSEGRIPPGEWDETRGRMDRYEQDVAGLKTDVAVLKSDVAGLKTDVSDLRTEMNMRFDRMSEQMIARSDRQTEQLNARFDRQSDQLSARFDQLGAQLNTRFDALQALIAERMDRQEERMARQTRWAIGMLGLVSTTVTLLLAIQALGLAG